MALSGWNPNHARDTCVFRKGKKIVHGYSSRGWHLEAVMPWRNPDAETQRLWTECRASLHQCKCFCWMCEPYIWEISKEKNYTDSNILQESNNSDGLVRVIQMFDLWSGLKSTLVTAKGERHLQKCPSGGLTRMVYRKEIVSPQYFL